MRRALFTAALVAICASVVAGVTASATIRHQQQSYRGPVSAGTAPADQVLLTADVEVARLATARYAINLRRAKADGYRIITRMIPNMGYHFMNPNVTGFDVRKPAILVYQHHGTTWQLGALEWVFTTMPSKSPLPGARYGVFGAGCHYVDGTFVPADAQTKCPPKSPHTGARFNFWHPRLITLHFWVWYPEPAGPVHGHQPERVAV